MEPFSRVSSRGEEERIFVGLIRSFRVITGKTRGERNRVARVASHWLMHLI